jgi:adenylosuccinate synthase
MLDGAYEALKGGRQIGTTKKGIGPAYTDKYSRVGIRMGDLLDKEYFAERLKDALAQKNIELQALGMEPCDFDTIYNQYLALGEQLRPMICDTSVLLNRLVEEGKKVLFEGAQGVMLCIDHGTYPFVTSSSPTAASVPVNTGLAPRYVDNVMGVAKAYTTRVGEGPFPTELFDERAEYIRERGHEYGTVTGRPRRVGWLDAVVLNHVRRISGVNYLSLMLFDVLSGLEKIRICTGYKLDGKSIDYVPSTIAQLERVEAEYIELDGWSEDGGQYRVDGPHPGKNDEVHAHLSLDGNPNEDILIQIRPSEEELAEYNSESEDDDDEDPDDEDPEDEDDE